MGQDLQVSYLAMTYVDTSFNVYQGQPRNGQQSFPPLPGFAPPVS
jgi:hypothetical protein